MMTNFRVNYIEFWRATNLFKSVSKCQPYLQKRKIMKTPEVMRTHKPRHLICFKQWTPQMVIETILSAMNLKKRLMDSHFKRLDILPNAKVMVLQEVNVPMLNLAVSKAATMLGATDCHVVSDFNWDDGYYGRIYSEMADVIFATTKTHMCMQRFADHSSVPVMCMMSRTHASILSLATVMSIMEEYGTMKGMNIAYVGPPHPVLNSYLLLCPMLGANIKFKCGCKQCPLTPLLLDASKQMCVETATATEQSSDKHEVLKNACVVIAGPTTSKKEKLPEFTMSVREINTLTCFQWIFFHTCPRGREVDDALFWNQNARTFNAFKNMHYITAALMAKAVSNWKF